MTTDDPCNCEHRCEHDDLCIGGHAYSPAGHWYHCEICSPPDAVGRLLDDGSTEMRMRRCGHVLWAPTVSEATRASTEHKRSCGVVAPQ